MMWRTVCFVLCWLECATSVFAAALNLLSD